MSKTPKEIMRDEIFPGPDWSGDLVENMIAALNAAGYVIVPREPTDGMVNASWHAPRDMSLDTHPHPIDAYRAMIDAALKD